MPPKTIIKFFILATTFLSSPAKANTAINEFSNSLTQSYKELTELPKAERIDDTLAESNVQNVLFEKLRPQNMMNYEYYGGAIYNTKNCSATDIAADFVNNSASSFFGEAYGGAIYNSGEINSITGNFKENFVYADSSSGKGGAIFNSGEIGTISASFIGNYIERPTIMLGLSDGGAISNSGNIREITGEFIGNHSSYDAGAIQNDGTIENISADFIGNYASLYGGAIRNYLATIKSLSGKFENNYSEETMGGAIYNHGIITKITADFIGNHAKGEGGAIVNDNMGGGTSIFYNIDSITGKFKDNYVDGKNTKGGAIYNQASLKVIINSEFKNNYAEASGSFAQGGAIHNESVIKEIVNSSFTENWVSGNDESQGGAIYSLKDLNISADAGKSLFSGNYVRIGEEKKSNAIYMAGTEGDEIELGLKAQNKGTVSFDDGINGKHYNLKITGDGSGIVRFNNTVENVTNLTLSSSSVTNLGLNANIQTENMLIANNDTSAYRQSAGTSPLIKVDIKVDKAANAVNAGAIRVNNDVSGNYNVLVNALNPDILANIDDAYVPFLFAPNDDETTLSSFNVTRVIGSPYLWKGKINMKGDEPGSTWYLYLTDVLNPNPDPDPENPDPENPDDKPSGQIRPVVPEIVAGAGLHKAAIEQTRDMAKNISGKIAAGREYCPGCGVYPAEWNGRTLRNAWVLAQGKTANINKPVDMDADIWGIEAGFDVQNDVNNTFGVFASYRKGEYDLSGKAERMYTSYGSEIDIDSYLAGLYYRYDKNMNWLFATVYGGIQQTTAQTDDGIAEFDTDGIEFGAGIEIGHTFALSNDLTLDPGLGLYYTQINFDDATDNVGKKYDWKNVRHLEAELSVKLQKQFEGTNVYFKPSVVQTLVDGDEVTVTNLGKVNTLDDETLGRIELGGRYGFTDQLSAYGWANYTFGSDYDATTVGLGLNYAF